MSYTPKGIYYPDPSGVPRRQDLQDLAESVDGLVPRFQFGSLTVSGSSLASGATITSTVNFPTPFTSTPNAQVSMRGGPGGSNFLVARIGTISSGSMLIYTYNVGPSAATWSGMTLEWMAYTA